MERTFKAIVVGIEEYDDAKTWTTLAGVGDIAARVAKLFMSKPLALPDGGRKDEAPRALKEAINAIPDRATLFGQDGGELESGLMRNLGGGRYEARFADLPPGQVTVRVESATPSRPLDPVTGMTLVWDEALAAEM